MVFFIITNIWRTLVTSSALSKLHTIKNNEKIIVFQPTRNLVKEFHEFLVRYLKVEATTISISHSGLTATEREENQNKWIYGSQAIIIATIAFPWV